MCRWGRSEKRKSEKENPERFDFAEAHSGLRLIRLVMTQNWPFLYSENTQKYNNKQINILNTIKIASKLNIYLEEFHYRWLKITLGI